MPTLKRATCVTVLSLMALGGCSRSSEDGVPAPFRAHYADLVLDVPQREDLFQARNYGWGLSTTVCNRQALATGASPLCEKLSGPVVSSAGLHTFVTAPSPATRFALLKERPLNAPAPQPGPMVTIPNARIDRALGGGGEAYQLSRISVLDRGSPLTTTANGWPLARCATHPLDNRYCTVGFLIRGSFVEFQVFAEQGAPLDQKQIWDVASAMDAKLRALSGAKN
jgi:hypothetical protein